MAPHATTTQNVYDTTEFFAKYSQYPRMIKGIDGASEWVRLRSMLPPSLAGLRVLDLGCGDGWFSLFAARQGSAVVHGCDISTNMLARAKDMIDSLDKGEKAAVSEKLTFCQMDLENVQLGRENYDLVFSGLAFHYVNNISTLLKRVHAALAPGGVLVFSIEHPIFTSPVKPGFRTYSSSLEEVDSGTSHDDQAPQAEVLPAAQGGHHHHYWPVANYFAEGERTVTWLVDGVRKQHRTIATYSQLLRQMGFGDQLYDEWGGENASSSSANLADKEDAATRKHPDWPEGVCPRFLLVAASKK